MNHMKKSRLKDKPMSFEWRKLFDGRMKWVTIPVLCVLVMGASWWGYVSVTVMKPVDAAKASVEDVANFLGNERGLNQMPVNARRDYLERTWRHYAQASPEQQRQAMQAMERMSQAQREQFAQAVAGVAKEDILKHAREYNRKRSAAEKTEYARAALNELRQTQARLTGGSSEAPGFNTAGTFRGMAPETPQEIQKQILNNSTGSERAQAEPFVNKMAEIHKSEIQLSRGG
jgi:hypothetical protein